MRWRFSLATSRPRRPEWKVSAIEPLDQVWVGPAPLANLRWVRRTVGFVFEPERPRFGSLFLSGGGRAALHSVIASKLAPCFVDSWQLGLIITARGNCEASGLGHARKHSLSQRIEKAAKLKSASPSPCRDVLMHTAKLRTERSRGSDLQACEAASR